jgi:methylaspartate ammonia-lyase
MAAINWNEFKQYKEYQIPPKKALGNLYLLIDFLMNEHHIVSLDEIYSIINKDSIGVSLLSKNEINTPEDIVKFMKAKTRAS